MDLNIPKNNLVSPINGTTQHTVFEVILLLAVAGLFYWFIVSPKMAELTAAQTQHDVIEKEHQSLVSNKNKLTTAIQKMKDNPDILKDLDEALPLDNKVTKLYIALESLTKTIGMTVGDINIAFKSDVPMAGNRALLADKYGAPRTLQKLSTTLSVTGTFSQFQTLLGKLETSGRLINISSVNITASKDDLLSFQVNLEAYFYE